jgi:LEA14-like dessication related protein
MAAVAAASMRGACQSVTQMVFTQPVVTLRDVKLASTTFTGGTLDVTLNVYNPNPYDLDVSQMTYDVIVDSADVGSGRTAQRVLLKSRDSSLVHLPVDFTWSSATAAGRIFAANGFVLYEVKGEIKAATVVGAVTIPFDQRGRFRSLAQSR